MKTTLKIDGLRDLDALLSELPQSTAKSVLRRVGIKALQPMAETARALAPDDPDTPDPDLESSITVGTKLNKTQAALHRKDEGRAFTTVFMGTNDRAGVLQEFGTVNHGPQPFLRPAFAQHAESTIRIVAEELGPEIIKTAARRARRAAAKSAKAI